MKNLRPTASLLLCALLAACASPRAPAPIVDRTPAPPPAAAAKPAEPAPQPKQVAGAKSGREADARGYYTVRRGDTLIHIALEFGQNYRDLITWNSLANPNDIKVDQVLRVLPPDGSPVVLTSPIASGPVSETRPLSSAAASASASASAATPASASAPASVASGSASANGKAVVLKEPLGDKRPYSEAALAEARKGDSAAPAVAAASTAPSSSVARAAPALPGLTPEDEAIGWTWPTQGKAAGPFEEAKRGIDIPGSSGQDVLAAANGKVTYAGNSIRGYGNLVIVRHTDNLLSAYAHNKTILVKENQMVTKGQKIAEMGNTDSDAVKLHFEIRQQGKPVDPGKFLPGH